MTEQKQIAPRRTLSIQELCEASAQDVFNIIVPALLEQGRPAKEGDNCVYDDGNGARCAVGLALNEEAHQLIKEKGLNTHSFYRVAEELGLPFKGKTANLISALQFIHDDLGMHFEGKLFRSRVGAGCDKVAHKYMLFNGALINSPFYVA